MTRETLKEYLMQIHPHRWQPEILCELIDVMTDKDILGLLSTNFKCCNCKHFDNHIDKAGYGYCNKDDSIDGKPINETLTYTVDAEYYKVWLKVHNTFGCIQFESKEQI